MLDSYLTVKVAVVALFSEGSSTDEAKAKCWRLQLYSALTFGSIEVKAWTQRHTQ